MKTMHSIHWTGVEKYCSRAGQVAPLRYPVARANMGAQTQEVLSQRVSDGFVEAALGLNRAPAERAPQ